MIETCAIMISAPNRLMAESRDSDEAERLRKPISKQRRMRA
jgi:hypothetical protein